MKKFFKNKIVFLKRFFYKTSSLKLVHNNTMLTISKTFILGFEVSEKMSCQDVILTIY